MSSNSMASAEMLSNSMASTVMSSNSMAIDALELQIEFAEGETIHTENSYKYSQQEIEELTARSSFHLERQWFDAGHKFSLNLFSPE